MNREEWIERATAFTGRVIFTDEIGPTTAELIAADKLIQAALKLFRQGDNLLVARVLGRVEAMESRLGALEGREQPGPREFVMARTDFYRNAGASYERFARNFQAYPEPFTTAEELARLDVLNAVWDGLPLPRNPEEFVKNLRARRSLDRVRMKESPAAKAGQLSQGPMGR